MQLILGLVLALVLFVLLKKWGALDPHKKKDATWKIFLGGAGVLLLFMILTGRAHVLTAAFAALIPLVRRLPSLLRFVPMARKMFGQGAQNSNAGQGQSQSQAPSANGQLSVAEACEILGVDQNCSREDIIAAHRRLMQKIHPDRGGNDYLAAKVNEAKSVMLARVNGDKKV